MKRGKTKNESVLSVSDQEKDSGLNGIAKEKVSRRTFLKGGVAAGAVVGLGAVGATSGSFAATTITQTTSNDPFASQQITLNVNGVNYPVTVEPRDMLVNVIRDDLGLTGTKRPCNRQECGGCTVLIDGVSYNSCNYIALRAQGKQILTIEGGVASTAKGAPPADSVVAALQSAFVQEDGGQCSFCSPGQIMAATALLKTNTNPTVDEIKAAQSGNLCRCGNYLNIVRSVQAAAQALGGA